MTEAITRRQLFGYAGAAAPFIAGPLWYLYEDGQDTQDQLLQNTTAIDFLKKKTGVDFDKIPAPIIEAEAQYWHWFKTVHYGEARNVPAPGGVLICYWELPVRPVAMEIHLPIIIGVTDNNYYATATPQIFVPEDAHLVGKPRERFRTSHYDRRVSKFIGKEGIQLPRTIPVGEYDLLYTYIFQEAEGDYPELLNGRIQPHQRVRFTVKA